MDFEKVIKGRRSVRNFQNRALKKEDLTKILNAARYAPSSGNIQNWRFVVVNKNKEKLFHASSKQLMIMKAPVSVVVCADHDAVARYGNRAKLYSIQNTSAAIENMLLMAESMGISSCWVGAFDHECVQRDFKIPDHVEPVAIICFGYSAEKKPTPVRRCLKTVTYFEKWGKKT